MPAQDYDIVIVGALLRWRDAGGREWRARRRLLTDAEQG